MTAKAKKEKLEKAKSIKASESCLRDEFAMAALPSLCHGTAGGDGQAEDIATRAYVVADAMLAARDPHPPIETADETHPIVETK